MLISPREYQTESLEAVQDFRANGITRQLICLPTGTGKTVVFALLAKEINVRTLVIAHTRELIDQAVEKFKVVWPDVDIGIVKGDQDDINAQVVVASIQTASKDKRLARLKKEGFGLMIIDEAHHSTAASYHKVIEELGFFTGSPDKLLVGVTATPKRSDGVGLSRIFQEIAFERSMPTMIRSGYLSQLLGKQVLTKIDLSDVADRKGDFISSQLSKVVNIPERNELIVENYIEFAFERKKSLAFCVDVKHAQDLADSFQGKGISAKAIYGAMSPEDRLETLKGFSEGKYKVLTNCQILTEGFDEPSIDCIVLARPTKSGTLFAQMVGRGTRKFPLKKDCLVLDFTDNASKHSLCSFRNTLDGAVMPLFEEDYAEEIEEEEALVEAETKETPHAKIIAESINDIDFFNSSAFAWTRVGDLWHLVLSKSKEVWVYPVEDGYAVQVAESGRNRHLSKRKLPLDYALGTAEDWARKNKTKNSWGRKDVPWRADPASEKQKSMLTSFGVSFEEGISKGQASDLINVAMNARILMNNKS